MTYSFFELYPIEWIIHILISLIITLICYSFFPLIIANNRNKALTANKYKKICYLVNLFIFLVFSLINGNPISSGAPYLLWTYVSTKMGLRTLLYRGLIEGFEKLRYFNKEIEDLTLTYKYKFLAEASFDNQDYKITFFDDQKYRILYSSLRKTKRELEYIFTNNLSTEDYLLEYLDGRAMELMAEGNIDDIIKRKGATYILSKIYEFTNDCLLQKGRLTKMQHKNKLSYINYLCEEYAKKRKPKT